jgi:hypothetical protein
MDELKQFANWWSLMGVAGALIAAASVNQQNPVGMYFGAALLLGGIGEWICRPQKTEIFKGPTFGSTITKRTNPWKPKPLGIAFDIAALAAFARVVWLVAFAP